MKISYGLQMSGVGVLVGGVTGIMQSANDDYKSTVSNPEQKRDRKKMNARAARRGLLLGGKYAGFVAGLVFSEIAIGRYRQKDDVWNLIGAGAITGGAFCARGGAAASIVGATMGGALSYLVGTGLEGLKSLEQGLSTSSETGLSGSKDNDTTDGAIGNHSNLGSMERQIQHMESRLQHWPTAPNKTESSSTK